MLVTIIELARLGEDAIYLEIEKHNEEHYFLLNNGKKLIEGSKKELLAYIKKNSGTYPFQYFVDEESVIEKKE